MENVFNSETFKYTYRSRVILKSRLTTLQMVNSKCIFVFMHFWTRFVSTIFHLPTTRMHEQSALPGFVQHMH